jgi:hypothetical protein
MMKIPRFNLGIFFQTDKPPRWTSERFSLLGFLFACLDTGGADQDLVAVNAANLQVHVLPALGGDMRVAAADAGHKTAFAVGTLSGHILAC